MQHTHTDRSHLATALSTRTLGVCVCVSVSVTFGTGTRQHATQRDSATTKLARQNFPVKIGKPNKCHNFFFTTICISLAQWQCGSLKFSPSRQTT